MAFLDKIKSVEVSEEAPKKVNPLLKKKLEPKKTLPNKPLKKIPLPQEVEEVEATSEEVMEEAAAETAAQAVVEEVVAEAKAEEAAKAEEVKEAAEEIKLPEEAPKAEAAEEKPEPEAAEEVPAEVEEVPVAEDETAEAVVEEVKEEDPAPKAKRQTRTKKAKKPEAEVTPSEEHESVEMPTTAMSFASAVVGISSPFVDEEWESFKAEVMEELSEINITPDMNPGTLKVVIAELSMLREKIWHPYQEAKNLYERLSSKEPEGLIERVKRINLGTGANDMERRKAGVMACMAYETPEGAVNLFEMMDESKERYTFLRGVIDSVKYKTDILITLNGALKLEKEHI